MVRLVGRPVHVIPFAASLTATLGWLAAGPVAGAMAAVYTALGLLFAHRRAREKAHAEAEVAAVDAVATAAADLRTGAPAASVINAAAQPLRRHPAAVAAVEAAWRVSEQTGAPLADVLDRVESQLRAGHRLRATAAAHAAGARATGFLLAVLPAAGIGLGYGMGADPLGMLFGTPMGSVCAAVATGLQVAGLLWTDRLSTVDVR
jgi:tight adherence protein B